MSKSVHRDREGFFLKLPGFCAPANPDGHRSVSSGLGIAGPAVIINEGSKEICFCGHSNNRCQGTV